MSTNQVWADFEVEEEEETEGGYSAYARVGSYSMVTQGEGLEELRKHILELIADYNLHEADKIYSYSLEFQFNYSPSV